MTIYERIKMLRQQAGMSLDDVEKETADKFNKHLKLKQNANEVQTEGEFSA